MKMDWSFPKQILLALIVLGSIGSYPLTHYASAEIIQAAIAGAILATINVLLGYMAIEYSFGKSATTFMKYVLGGMGVRMFTLAGLLILLIKMFGFHAGALVTSMGIYYVVYLVLELNFIHKKVSIKQQS